MTLHEYLMSEQAREDVRALVDGREEFVGPGGLCIIAGPEGKWRAMTAIDDAGDEVLARVYYRPDGDRFVVTDLGEGVRALRLKKGDVLVRHPYIPDGTNYTDVHSGVLVADPEPSAPGLPDAICRVMLASLRVAEVAP